MVPHSNVSYRNFLGTAFGTIRFRHILRSMVLEASTGSPCFHRLIDPAVLLKPFNVSSFGVFLNITQQLHGLGFIAGLAPIILRDDSLDLHRHDKIVGSNQPYARHPFSRNSHSHTSSRKCTVTNLATPLRLR